ncbi:MAG: (2Fe-2S)-binding protein [Pirellulaceae bacterium]|nr:(2Fe-2S)-binding protein [Planctomycetales bacterium]
MSEPTTDQFSRRAFFKGSGAVAAATMVSSEVAGQDVAASPNATRLIKGMTLKVNGKQYTIENVEARTTLLDVLRLRLNLTGAKPVSMDGSSGASTVLIDGRPAMASTTLAASVVGKEITTIEGLPANDAVPHAFVADDAQQCGFCTPGFVMAVRAFLNRHPEATDEQLRSGLNGNICRCGTYANIIRAAVSIVKGEQNG